MKGKKILVLNKYKAEGERWADHLRTRGHDVQYRQGCKNPKEGDSFDVIVTSRALSCEGKNQDAVDLAAQMQKENVKAKRILVGNEKKDCNAEVTDNFDRFVENEKRLLSRFPKNLANKIREITGTTLAVGFSGAGNLGKETIKIISSEDYVGAINIHSNHYKSDYSRLWDQLKVHQGKLKGFDSIKEMCDSVQDLDFFGLTAGVRGETAPKEGVATQDRSAGFLDTIKLIQPRLDELMHAIKDGKYKGITGVGTGPQDIILPYMREMGFPDDKIVGITPDPLRSRYMLRNRIIGAVYAVEHHLGLDMANLGPEQTQLIEKESRGLLSKLERDKIEGLRENELADIRRLSKKDRDTLRDLRVEDVDLTVLGGRSWPIPIYSACHIKGEPITEKLPNFTERESTDLMDRKLQEYGWNLVKIAKAEGGYYDDSPNEFKNLLYVLHKGIEHPSEMLMTWNPKYQIHMQGPVTYDDARVSVEWNEKAVPELEDHYRSRLESGVTVQKEITKRKIQEYKDSKKT